MNASYRQDTRLPFAQQGTLAQPGAMKLHTSYGFDRGPARGPATLPNAQTLPAGWSLWDIGGLLVTPPWVDAARREAVIHVEPNDGGSDQFQLAGFIRRLPAALTDEDGAPTFPEFWIYSEVGSYYQKLPTLDSADNTVLGMGGIALFEDQLGLLPAGEGSPVVNGIRLSGDHDEASALGQCNVWTDSQALFTRIMQAPSFGARAWVRYHVVQEQGVTPGISFDGGEHWIDGGEKPVEFIRWLGMVATAGASILTPENNVTTYQSCGEIAIFVPNVASAANEALESFGGQRQT